MQSHPVYTSPRNLLPQSSVGTSADTVVMLPLFLSSLIGRIRVEATEAPARILFWRTADTGDISTVADTVASGGSPTAPFVLIPVTDVTKFQPGDCIEILNGSTVKLRGVVQAKTTSAGGAPVWTDPDFPSGFPRNATGAYVATAGSMWVRVIDLGAWDGLVATDTIRWLRPVHDATNDRYYGDLIDVGGAGAKDYANMGAAKAIAIIRLTGGTNTVVTATQID